MRRPSLFRKILIGQIVIFGLVALGTSAFSAWNIYRKLMAERLSKGKAIVSSIVYTSQFLLESSPPETTQNAIDEFLAIEGVSYVFAIDADRNIIAHTFVPTIPTEIRALTNSETTGTVVRELEIEGVGQFIDISSPILLGVGGHAHVGIDKSEVVAHIREAIVQQLALILVLFALSAIASYLLIRQITQPLVQLTEYAQQLSARNFPSDIDIRSTDEIGLLAATMQSMASEISGFLARLERAVDDTTRKLQQAQSQVVHNEKMTSLGQMVAGVAHEINNPVGFIHSNTSHVSEYVKELLEYLQLYRVYYPEPHPEIQERSEEIELDFLQEDLEKTLGSMRMGTNRIRELVSSLRNFSRLDESAIKAVNLHEGIDSTLVILRHRLKATSDRPEIRIVKKYGELPLVECYPSQLNQVFVNLIGNAIDALESATARIEDGMLKVEIYTAVIADQAIIRVRDNGSGIPAEVREKIFDPFFTTKPIGKGTGLGLSISHHIVTEKHRGRLVCRSESGYGTEFEIVIPLCLTGESEAPPTDEAELPAAERS
ncbi:MAG: ATP-binding protein [Geitlerinemataceae cyanobacterium]